MIFTSPLWTKSNLHLKMASTCWCTTEIWIWPVIQRGIFAGSMPCAGMDKLGLLRRIWSRGFRLLTAQRGNREVTRRYSHEPGTQRKIGDLHSWRSIDLDIWWVVGFGNLIYPLYAVLMIACRFLWISPKWHWISIRNGCSRSLLGRTVPITVHTWKMSYIHACTVVSRYMK